MKNHVKESTFISYSVNIDKHILPALGERDAESLEYKDIDLFVAGLNTSGLNNTTVRYVLKVMKQALSFCVKRQYIRFNIMDVYEMPRKNNYTHTILDENEMVALLDGSKGTEIELCILFMACYGIRRGECLGLRYSDIHDNVLEIRRTSHMVAGKFLTTDCKTEKSKRDIKLLEADKPLIEAYNIRCARNPEGFLMRKEAGSRITQNILQREYKLLLEKLGLPNVRLHDLRHSYATLMMRNGVNPKIVSTTLGHSSIGITMDLYSHADISMQDACLNVVGSKLRHR